MEGLELQITAGSEAEIEAHRRFLHAFLRLSDDALEVFNDVANYPFCPMLQIDAALLGLYGLTRKGAERAQRHLDIAPLEKGNPREWSFFKAISQMASRQYDAALTLLEEHMRRWPDDLMGLKVAEFAFYLTGQQYQAHRFLRLTTSLLDHYQESAPFWAMHSFALELTGQYDVAEEVAMRSLELEAGNPWAHHTLTHVCIETGQIDRGIELLEGFAPALNSFGRFARSHSLWHLALLYRENLDFAAVSDVINRASWLEDDRIVSEEVDASSLLWRLDMEGQEIQDHWNRLARTIGSDASFVTTPFVATQLVYALKRGGSEEPLANALDQIGRTTSPRWNEIGRPLVYAAVACAEGHWIQAATLLDPIMDRVGWAGGSDAQVDLFREVYFKSLLKAGRTREARGYLESIVRDRDLSQLKQRWLLAS
jgi:tetratricopeptide (TPR) repeat protein